MNLPIPPSVIYAGCAGVLISLLVATAQQKWKWKVFFLLALRLAIGWQFLFEGMHKIHSHMAGPIEGNRPFNSEPYFKEAPGPLAGFMRSMNGDPTKIIADKLTPKAEMAAGEFAKLSEAEQAAQCPDSVAKELDEFAASVGKTAEDSRAAFARWIHGVDRREIKLARISGDPVSFTAPQRLHYLELLKKEKELADAKLHTGMGGGYGIDVKRAQSSRADFWNAQADLVKDIDTFVAELKTTLNDGKAPAKSEALTNTQRSDLFTRWFLAIVGACIFFGLFTRLSCLAAAVFLLMTYLTHPPFPWFTLPPGTEGNPLFINKNAIEFFALMALACMKTGQWLGLDAMICYVFGSSKKSDEVVTK